MQTCNKMIYNSQEQERTDLGSRNVNCHLLAGFEGCAQYCVPTIHVILNHVTSHVTAGTVCIPWHDMDFLQCFAER